PEHPLRVANRALVEVANVRRSVTEVQRDLGQLKDTVEQHEAQDRASQLRISALEERVTTITQPPPPAPVVVVPTPPPTPAAKSKAVKAAAPAQPRPQTPRIISVIEVPTAANSPVATEQETPQLETGSIAPAPPVISFGEPEVTRA